jgi:hypothetical protein
MSMPCAQQRCLRYVAAERWRLQYGTQRATWQATMQRDTWQAESVGSGRVAAGGDGGDVQRPILSAYPSLYGRLAQSSEPPERHAGMLPHEGGLHASFGMHIGILRSTHAPWRQRRPRLSRRIDRR